MQISRSTYFVFVVVVTISGAVVIKAQFDRADDFIGGIARVQFGRFVSRYPCSGEICIESFAWDSEMGYIDKTGKFIWKPTK